MKLIMHAPRGSMYGVKAAEINTVSSLAYRQFRGGTWAQLNVMKCSSVAVLESFHWYYLEHVKHWSRAPFTDLFLYVSG